MHYHIAIGCAYVHIFGRPVANLAYMNIAAVSAL